MKAWKEYRIEDLIQLEYGKALTDYRGDKGLYDVFGTNGKIGLTDKFLYNEPSIIIGRKGAYREVHFAQNPFFVINTAFYTKPKTNLTNTVFIYYWFKNIDINAMDSGSAIPSTSRDEVYDLNISLPPLPEQTAIAEVLSSLDDKIDLLQRQNKTLEEMAEAVFRQWFLEEVKEGWEEKSLYDAIKLVGGGTPKTENNEFWDGDIKWLSGGDIASAHKNFVVTSEKTITKLGLDNSSARLLPKFATIISARGTVGKFCLLSEPMAFSQSNYGILPVVSNCYFFTYLLTASSVTELQAASYGSVFDTITTNTFKDHKLKIPDDFFIQEFEVRITPFFEKMLINTSQIRTLTQLRDDLLPKLMSGEILVTIEN